MKKIIPLLLCLFLTVSTPIWSQTLSDVLRYNAADIPGDARFTAMGGAFGALGGNLSGMSLNPAGSSVFLYTELGLSAQLTNQNIESAYFSSAEESSKDRFRFPQFGGVFVMEGDEDDWTKVSFGFNIQRLQDFNRVYRVSGNNPNNGLDAYFLNYAQGNALSQLELLQGETYGDAYADIGEVYGYGTQQAFLGYQGYIINPDSYDDNNTQYSSNAIYDRRNHQFLVESSGYHRKFTFNFSAAYQNKFHIGLNINSHQVEYEESNGLEERGYATNSGLQYTYFANELSSLGRGLSFDLGVIALYNDLRVGLSYQSPTWFTFVDETKQRLDVDYLDNNQLISEIIDPGVINGYPEYDLRTPSKLTLSMAYTFKGRGLISIDFGTQNPQNTRFEDQNSSYFAGLNDRIKNEFIRSNFLRVGSEIRVNDQISLRAGYSTEGALQSSLTQENNSYSIGVGYDMGASALNLALVKRERLLSQELYSTGLDDHYTLNFRPLQVVVSYVFRL
ncbi:MAG: hypothetical protein ACPGC5_06775 [Flavobacteriaceae bacterium]